MGSSHKAIGAAVGAAFAAYGFSIREPAYFMAFLTAPIAALLPDIDHAESTVGKHRGCIAAVLVSVLTLVAAAVAWYFGDVLLYHASIIVAAGVGGVLLLLTIFRLSKTAQNTVGFLTKHRGIMHTLLIPGAAIFAATLIEEPHIAILLHSFAAGYASHIFADCLTTMGCPILFPFTSKNIRFARVVTGEPSEKVALTVLICVILFAAVLLAMGMIPWLGEFTWRSV